MIGRIKDYFKHGRLDQAVVIFPFGRQLFEFALPPRAKILVRKQDRVFEKYIRCLNNSKLNCCVYKITMKLQKNLHEYITLFPTADVTIRIDIRLVTMGY